VFDQNGVQHLLAGDTDARLGTWIFAPDISQSTPGEQTVTGATVTPACVGVMKMRTRLSGCNGPAL
jgi:hypothetical protein